MIIENGDPFERRRRRRDGDADRKKMDMNRTASIQLEYLIEIAPTDRRTDRQNSI